MRLKRREGEKMTTKFGGKKYENGISYETEEGMRGALYMSPSDELWAV